VTRLRISVRLTEDLPSGDYEVLYVRTAAGEIQVAPTLLSVGQKEKPKWESLQQHPGVSIECMNCRGWYGVAEIAIDEVRGWRCPTCRGSLT
jgi:hypothetical protein